MGDCQFRVAFDRFDEDDHPMLLGVYQDGPATLAAAAAALAALPEHAPSTRYIVFPAERGSLRYGDHEVLLARRIVGEEQARERAVAIVRKFDEGWATISSLVHSLRAVARTELVESIVRGIMADD